MTSTINEILSPAGRKWLAKFKLNKEQLSEFCRTVAARTPLASSGMSEGMSYQCGGAEIETEYPRSLPGLLGMMISAQPEYDGDGGSSLFVATWNNKQKDNTAIFRAAGFSKPTRWTTNPNTGNKIRGSMCVLNPKYRKQKKEDKWSGW